MCGFWIFVFFFKQKTAYEMRISDWSSDVCSSDLAALVLAPALLDHRDRLPHFTARFEVAHQDHGIGEIADVHRCTHVVADQAVMRARPQRRDTPLAQKAQQLVQLDDEELLAGQRIELTIEAVTHPDRTVFLVYHPAIE